MTDTTAATGTDTNNAGDAPTDSQTVADTTTAQPAAESQKDEAPAVPEAYEFTMPEGVALDKAASDEFSAVAKELKLDQATAQKVADVGIKMAQRQQEVFESTKTAWAEQARTDKDIGGDKFDQSMVVALKTLNSFGSPELKEVLNASGLGNHPAVIRAFLKVGQQIADTDVVKGTPTNGAAKSLSSALYGS